MVKQKHKFVYYKCSPKQIKINMKKKKTQIKKFGKIAIHKSLMIYDYLV